MSSLIETFLLVQLGKLVTSSAPPQDGTLIVHSVRRGQFLRTLRPAFEGGLSSRITELAVGMEGHLVAHAVAEGRHSGKV